MLELLCLVAVAMYGLDFLAKLCGGEGLRPMTWDEMDEMDEMHKSHWEHFNRDSDDDLSLSLSLSLDPFDPF